MTALFTLLPIFGFATIFNVFFKKNISVSIFFSISFIITLMFGFGIFDLLHIGSYILFYGGIFLLGIMSILYTEKLFKDLNSVPLFMFVVMSGLYLYFMKDAQLFFWDEYSHWGKFIKYMYFTNTFYDLNSTAAHLNYPPGISLWDYFVLKPFDYSEGNIYFAYFLIIFSSTLMMYEGLSFKDIHWIGLVLAIQVVVYASFGHWFSCIYVDHVIGAFSVGLVLAYISDKFTNRELFLFIFPFITIVLIKEVGLYFGLSAIGFIYVFNLFKNYKIEHNLIVVLKDTKKLFFILFILFIAMFLVLKIWTNYQDKNGISQDGQTLSAVAKNIFTNQHLLKPKIEQEVKDRLDKVLLYQQLHKEKVSLNYNEFSYSLMGKYTKDIKLTTVSIFFFFMIIVILRYFSYKKYRKEVLLAGIYFSITTSIYIFFILYQSYFVAFGTGALRIPSYVRYANIGILPLVFVMFMIFLPVFNGDKSKKLFFSGLIALSLLAFITKPYLKPLYIQLQNPTRNSIDKITKDIDKIVPSKSKLFVVFPIRNNGSLNNILSYSLTPIKATISKYDFEKKSFNEMIQIYSKYQYLWFAQLNNKLVQKNMKILKMKSKGKPYMLYKISVNHNNITFKPIL